MAGKRNFTCVVGNKEHGTYTGSSPSSAARKAVSKLCADDKKKKVTFYLREMTQGSKKKTYGPYNGHVEKLKEPIELKGRVIKYKPVAKLAKTKGGDNNSNNNNSNRNNSNRNNSNRNNSNRNNSNRNNSNRNNSNRND